MVDQHVVAAHCDFVVVAFFSSGVSSSEGGSSLADLYRLNLAIMVFTLSSLVEGIAPSLLSLLFE
jgi:hypothetical protein